MPLPISALTLKHGVGVALTVVQNERNRVGGKRGKVDVRYLDVDLPSTACASRRQKRNYFGR
jgi:hypothetical protein